MKPCLRQILSPGCRQPWPRPANKFLGAGDWYADLGEYRIFPCSARTLLYTNPAPDVDKLEILYRNEWSVPTGQAYHNREKPTRALPLGLRAKKFRRLVLGDCPLEIGRKLEITL